MQQAERTNPTMDPMKPPVQPGGCPFAHERVQKSHVLAIRNDIAQNGYSPEKYPVAPLERSDNLEARYIEQRVALEAEFTPRILERAANEGKKYPPYGLLTPVRTAGNQQFVVRHTPLEVVPLKSPFEVLEDSMNYTFKVALVEELCALSTSTSPRDAKAQALLDGMQEHIAAGNIVVNTVEEMFLMAINTATETSAKLLEVAKPAYMLKHPDEKPTADTLADVTANSLPLLIELALLPADKYSIARRVLGGSADRRAWAPFDPTRFTIKSEKYGERLDLTDAAREQIEKEYEALPQKKKHNSGCPAVYSGTIRGLWEWNVAVGREIFAQQVSQQVVFEKMVA